MASEGEVRKRLDGLLAEQQRWWGLEVTGWTVLWFTAIPTVFVFTGMRVGSWFWVWTTGLLGMIGLVLTGVSRSRRLWAEEEFSFAGQRLRRDLLLQGPRRDDERKAA